MYIEVTSYSILLVYRSSDRRGIDTLFWMHFKQEQGLPISLVILDSSRVMFCAIAVVLPVDWKKKGKGATRAKRQRERNRR